MEGGIKINNGMFAAVKEGQIEKVKEIIEKYGLSCCQLWEGGNKLLWIALENSHLEIAELLITRGCKVNYINCGRSIFDFCISNDKKDILEMILKRGVNVDMYAALEISVRFKQAIELLLKYGADINAEYSDKGTLLHQAFDKRCLESIEYLLNRGAEINGVCTRYTKKGYTPLHFAAKNDCEKVVKLLLSRGANVDAKAKDEALLIASSDCIYDKRVYGYTTFDNAAGRQKIKKNKKEKTASQIRRAEIVKLLLDAGADINYTYTKCTHTHFCNTFVTDQYKLNPLLIAIENRNEILVKLLLERGANIEHEDILPNTALKKAVKCGHPGIVKQILQYAPVINNPPNIYCLQSTMKGHYNKDIVESLLEYGFSVRPQDAKDAELLQKSVQYGHLRVIEDLLKYGANINALFSGDFTLLHEATFFKQKEAVNLLIKYGANINAKATNGLTPLSIAIDKEYLEIVNIFLNLKESIETQPYFLYFAVIRGNKEIIETLLQHKFDVSAREYEGCTVLHFNALHSNESRAEIAELLITKGANVNAQNRRGQTTLHYACSNKFPDLVKTLLFYEADINIMDSNSFTPLDIAWSGYFENDYCLYNPEGSSTNKALDILLCHVFKMKMANLFLNERNLEVIRGIGQMNPGKQDVRTKFFQKYNSFENECKQEIARMKNKTFENSSISFYEILANDTKIVAKYMNNENIVQELKSDNYKSEFPIYARMIEINFIKGMGRKKLLDEVKYNFYFVSNPFKDLPHQCANKILDLLCTSDLQNLKDAFSLPNCV